MRRRGAGNDARAVGFRLAALLAELRQLLAGGQHQLLRLLRQEPDLHVRRALHLLRLRQLVQVHLSPGCVLTMEVTAFLVAALPLAALLALAQTGTG